MATTACSECSEIFDTGRDSYPYCCYECRRESDRRKARRAERESGGGSPPRPGRVYGFS